MQIELKHTASANRKSCALRKELIMLWSDTSSYRNVGNIEDGFTPKKTGFFGIVGAFLTRVKAHADMQRLQRLDDRMLKDLGLMRGDLDWAVMQDEHDDPTKALQSVRNERMCAARKAARQ
jgi:hypothetical protein